MISYYEMTAHNCGTVHAPGLAWPEYVYQPPKKQCVRTPRRVDFELNKRLILAEMQDGIERTVLSLKAKMSIGNGSIYKCLKGLAYDGHLEFRVERSRRNIKQRVYFLAAKKCLH